MGSYSNLKKMLPLINLCHFGLVSYFQYIGIGIEFRHEEYFGNNLLGMFGCNFMFINSFSKFIVSTGSFGQAS